MFIRILSGSLSLIRGTNNAPHLSVVMLTEFKSWILDLVWSNSFDKPLMSLSFLTLANETNLFTKELINTCVCVCVCVCVFILFHLLVSSDCKTSVTYLRCSDQHSFVVSIISGASAKFLHLRIWKCHISPPKTKTSARSKLERKRYDIICSAERWYILI